ncbi:unnamed protein product, partial [Gadus morhua 'NCC']
MSFYSTARLGVRVLQLILLFGIFLSVCFISDGAAAESSWTQTSAEPLQTAPHAQPGLASKK